MLELKSVESDNAAPETIINESGIDDVFESVYNTVISIIQKSLGKGSGWIIDSVLDPTN